MKLKWYHRKRLIRLADKLEGKGPYAAVGPVPARKFDMQHLAQEFKGGDSIDEDEFKPHECKTAACALGWAGSDPWFNRRMDFGTGRALSAYLFHAYNYKAGRNVRASTVAARLREVAARE